jgi:hypothetical protein
MAFRLAPVGLPHLLRPAPSKTMYLRPSTRMATIAESAAPGSTHYLVACVGERDGAVCGHSILLSPTEKTICPHCGRVYGRGYLGYAGPIAVTK